MSSPVCMACVPASYVDLECKHLFESADVAAAGAQGCSCDSLVYVYLRREQDGVHCLSNLTKIKNNIGNVYSSHCVHIHHVYSSPCVHIHHVYSSTSYIYLFTFITFLFGGLLWHLKEGSAWIHIVYVDARAWIHMVYVDAMAWIHMVYVIFDLCKITKTMYTVLFSS